MYRFPAKSVVVFGTVKRSVGLLTRSPLFRRSLISSPPLSSIRHHKQIFCLNETRSFTTYTKTTEKINESEDCSHIMWWKEKMQMCEKESSMEMIKRLSYSNLLGLDYAQYKRRIARVADTKVEVKYPRKVFLHRVGPGYVGFGFDACILVEYADALHVQDGKPRAYVPDKYLGEAVDNLKRHEFSVCVMEPTSQPTDIQQVPIIPPCYHESDVENIHMFWSAVAKVVSALCYEKLIELCKIEHAPGEVHLEFFIVHPCKPPTDPSISFSSVYLMLTPHQTLYIGKTDDIEREIPEQRSKKGMKFASFLYFIVPNASVACELKTLLIKHLPEHGFELATGAR